MYASPLRALEHIVLPAFAFGLIAGGCDARNEIPTSTAASAQAASVEESSTEWSISDRYIVVLRDSATDLALLLRGGRTGSDSYAAFLGTRLRGSTADGFGGVVP